MILTCPSCGTRYVVKDGAIPAAGRTVRCAQCKHSWHQDPEESAADASLSEVSNGLDELKQHFPEQGHEERRPEPALDHPLGEPSGNPRMAALGDHAHPDYAGLSEDPDAQPLPGPLSNRPASERIEDEPLPAPVTEPEGERETMPQEAAEAVDPYPEEVVPAEEPVVERSSHPLRAARADAVEDMYSPFAPREEEAAPPRSRWPLVAGLVLLVIAAIAVAFWFLAPTELKSRIGLAQANGASPLLLQVKQHSRQQLASGNQMLEVSGLVINPTDEPQTVPPLQAQLRSLDQNVVHRWTIPPPSPRLAPGGSASFNSAELDIPPTAACLDVFFGSPREPQPPCRDARATEAAGA